MAGIEPARLGQSSAQGIQRLFDRRIHLLRDGSWRQTLVGSDEEIVLARVSQTRQGMAGRRLAECEVISGATDGAELVNGLKDGQQVEIKAAQIEHERGALVVGLAAEPRLGGYLTGRTSTHARMAGTGGASGGADLQPHLPQPHAHPRWGDGGTRWSLVVGPRVTVGVEALARHARCATAAETGRR